MYAHRFTTGSPFRPGTLGVALAINGAVIGALWFASPDLVKVIQHPPLVIDTIPLAEPIPEPEPSPRPHPLPRQVARPTASDPIAPLPPVNPVLPGLDPPLPPLDPLVGTGSQPGSEATPLAPPTFVAAAVDPRYAADFQPPYPDSERSLGNEGVVRLRILVGIDGRVKQVEPLAGPAAFVRAAVDQAQRRWRFKPATRGGIPEENWLTMSVRFRLG